MLVGREVKHVKEFDISGARCILRDQLLLCGAHIPADNTVYSAPYETNRDRTLLVTKAQKRSIKAQLLKGFWVVPIEIIERRGRYKVKLGIGKPIKKGDKREKMKEKQVKREIYD